MNEKYIDLLDKLANISKAKGDFFKEKAYKRAMEEIYLMDEEITDIDKLKGIYGFGEAIIKKMKEFQKTGRLKYLENKEDLILVELTQIHGIGAKKAKELVTKHKIKSIEELTSKKDEVLNDKQKLGLKYYEDIKRKIPREEIQEYEKIFKEAKLPKAKLEIVGSYRRKKKLSGDIDVILTSDDNDPEIYKHFVQKLKETNVIVEMLSNGKVKSMAISQLSGKPARRLDILFTPPDQYSFAILYFTGSKMFNIGMRRHALSMGLSLNEHGITEVKSKKKLPLELKTERDIFSFLGLEFVNPEKRIGIKNIQKLKKKRKRCPRGTRMNKTTGECEKVRLKLIPKPKTPSPPPKPKRCEKGTRRNKKTGKCEKIELKRSIKSKPEKKPKTKTKKKSMRKELEAKVMSFKTGGVSYLSSLPEKDVVDMIRFTTDMYHNQKSILTDMEYDILKEYAERTYPESEVHSEIGAPLPKTIRNKVTLPYKMFSMDKIKPDTSALVTWKSKYTGPYVISCKLDGVSGLYSTEHDKQKLYTRGNGLIGQDVSNLIKYLKLPTDKDTVIRGEFIIPKSIHQKKYPDSNARNIVSGIINSKKQVVAKYKDMRFVAYEVIKPVLKPSEQLKYLEAINSHVVMFKETKDISNENLSQLLKQWRHHHEYDIDGIIVTDDKIHPRVDKNPEHAFAFKMLLGDQTSEAKVVDVRWVVSKDGLLKPTVEIEPIKILGSTITYATAHNADFIEKNKLGPGAVILLSKSGDVIPKIVETIVPASSAKMPDIPYVWNKTHKEIMVESPDSDPVVKERNIIHFFEKLNIPGMKEKTIRKIMNHFKGISREEIIKLTMEQLLELPGIKETSAEKIHTGIQKALKETPIALMVAASNIFGPGIGPRIINNVLKHYPDFFKTKEDSLMIKTKLNEIDGLGQITSDKLALHRGDFLSFAEEIGYAIRAPTKKTSEAVSAGEQKEFAMTGSRDSAVKEKIESLGGVLGSSVTKKTHMLIAKDVGSESSSITKAKKYGIPVVSNEEFLKM